MSERAFENGAVVRVEALQALDAYGYDGGRMAFRRFCRQVFEAGGPRFLRSPSGALAVFRHADVRALAAMPQLATVAPNQLFPGLLSADLPDEKPVGFAIANVVKNQMFSTNAPANPALRRVLLNEIGPKQAAARTPMVEALARQVLAAVPRDAEVDGVAEIAEPLIGRYWGTLLGMTEEEALTAAQLARKMSPMLALNPEWSGIVEADGAAKAYYPLVEGAGRRALERGGCPFVETMAQGLAAIDIADDLDHGGYIPKTVGAFLAGNLFDGFHTAALAVANTLRTLLEHPEVMARLRKEPAEVGAAVAECLRLEPPVIHLNRIASADIVHDDLVIPSGTLVMMMWGAANRDPAAFPDPERFDLTRPQQGSTTFGGGAHICPGRFVASHLAKALVQALIEQNLDLRPAGPIDEWMGNHAMNQLRRLPVRFHEVRPF